MTVRPPRAPLAILLALAASVAARAECPEQGLLEGRAPAWTALVRGADSLADGRLAVRAEPSGLARFERPFGTVVWDLGGRFAVRSAFLQAGAGSAWEVAVSDDGVHWDPVWRPRGSSRPGLVVHARSGMSRDARWVRLDLLRADGPSAPAGEFQVFCHDRGATRVEALPQGGSGPDAGVVRAVIGSPAAPVVGLLLLALVLGRAARGVRVSLRPDARRWAVAAAGLLLAAWGVLAISLPGAGYNIDEDFQTRHGIELVDWYGRLLGQRQYRPFEASVPTMNYYGGLFEIGAELAARASPLDRLETRHLVTALVGSFALVGTYLLSRTVAGRGVGFLAALFLLATPRFEGHLLNNPKDVPFAVAYVFALAAICGALRHLPSLRPRWVAALGLACGAAAGIRVGGIVVLAYFALACGAWWLLELRRERRLDARRLARLAASLSAVAVVSWCVMLLSWPWAWSSPWSGPVRALTHFSDIPGSTAVSFPVFFEGRQIPLPDVPRHFTLKWLLLSAPEFWLLAPAALAALARRGRDPAPDASSRLRPLALAVIAASVALPLTLTLVGSVTQFDAVRHFVFLFPPLSVLLALSVAAGLRALGPSTARGALAAAGVGLVALTACDAARLHPYEYVYFNRLVAGGLHRAAERYETDYLGLSFREGVEWLLAHRRPDPEGRWRLTGCPGYFVNVRSALERAGPRAEGFEFVPAGTGADFALAFERVSCHRRFGGRAIATVRRDGTPLLYVLERRDGRPPP